VFLWINDKMFAGKGHLLMLDKDGEGSGTGTLLGDEQKAVAHPDDGQPVREAADAEAESLDVSVAPREDADDDEPAGAGAGDDLAGIKIEDVDKNATERKTRRRRRQPKE
jgi:preprotein translocase subunit SecF